MESELSTQSTLRPAQILAFRLGVSYHPPDSPSLPGTLAFETIRGTAGVDFIGTDSVDVLFALNETGAITVDAKDGNDTIDVADANGIIGTVTIKGGAGNDTIRAQDSDGAGAARFSSADVKGGAGDDTITSNGSVTSVLRGNEGNDDFVLTGNYTNSTVNGNSGVDTFTVGTGIVLSNSKVLGGSGNDGVMNFTAGTGIDAAVDSTINGSKGVDNITIGRVGSASNLFVHGGQDADTITVTNSVANGITYSGDKGSDTISVTGNAAASVLGGDDNDRIIVTGTGNNTLNGEAGNDVITIGGGTSSVLGGDGNDTITDGAGSDTITGGAGADVYTEDASAGTSDRYVIGAGDSAATLSGITNGFDGFTARFTLATNTIDISAVSAGLLGDAVVQGTTNVTTTAITNIIDADNVTDFSELVTYFSTAAGAAELDASGAGVINANIFTITDTDAENINGTYMIINNGNTLLDGGDLMFEINAASVVGDFAYAPGTASDLTTAAFII